MSKIQRAIVAAAVAGGLAFASSASAQIWTNPGTPATGVNNAFPAQNPQGPIGAAYQLNYPYGGQCVADTANNNLYPLLTQCTGGSFAGAPGVSERTDGGWAGTGAATSFKVVGPVVPSATTPKFVYEVLNPMDYTPDTTTYAGAHLYVLGVHEAWGAQNIATAGTAAPGLGLTLPFGLFPDPTALGALCGPGTAPVTCDIPNGMQWTGLRCETVGGCPCPADASPAFAAKYCAAGSTTVPLIPVGNPLFTPIWGVGQINMAGGPVTSTLNGLAASLPAPALAVPGTPGGVPATGRWSTNGYVSTWPSISVRANKGTPVVVQWVNEFPNNHVLCPHPEAADWPCAIDRTFMGVKATIDPALATVNIPPEGVNQYGSPQQPDNSWVTHLHGGEIPPSTDGFAEKWYGNAVTAVKYAGLAGNYVTPPFENPSGIHLKRPTGNADTYTYPMVQEEATIWFHDHTLGKTHHNVIAGPAGFFPVKEPLKHGKVTNGTCVPAAGQTCDYTWLDPVTEPRGALNIPMFDLFLAIQDRAFNDDGSISFSNGLGQAIPLAAPAGYTPVTSGANPMVHPVWVPEYFGDFSIVNGTLWPKATVEPGWYRVRLVDGSDSRCYTMGLNVAPNVLGVPAATPAPGARVANNLQFWVIANDQGYLKTPVRTTSVTMCPGERYELLINFGALGNRVANGAAASVFLTNTAAAPFPAGLTPQAIGSPFADLNVLMRFNVNPAKGPGLKSCNTAGAPIANSWDPIAPQSVNLARVGPTGPYASACMPANPSLVVDPGFVDLRPAGGVIPPTAIVRQVYLNEKVDGVTAAPLGMQLNGVPFEYKVTETPKVDTVEYWQFINLTVDAHPMHPHLVKHQVVSRQTFNVGQYKARLCGSTTCQPGPSPGNEMQVVPDVTPLLTGLPVLVTAGNPVAVPAVPGSFEGGFKDAVQVPPGRVTTIVADWTARWAGAGSLAFPAGTPNAPGTTCGAAPCTVGALPWTYETVTSGPYVWHCHINSHEDSEMMRTSLVVP